MLASTAALLIGGIVGQVSASPFVAARDLGGVPEGATINATLWLRAHDEAAFKNAVNARMIPGSPEYHKWMTPAEVASYNATDGDVAGLEAALRQQGLTVLDHGDDNASIRVSGPAGAMQAAFRTRLHVFEKNGAQYYAATTAPSFAGPGADLIGGIAGLTDGRLTPYFLHQIDLSTGQPVPMRPVTTSRLSAVFTDNCFLPHYKLVLGHLSVRDQMTGPRYTPSDNGTFCGYTPAQAATHYGLNAVYQAGYMGDGETIVLIDAYGSPTITSDVNVFSQMMGLPALTSANFSIVFPDGQPTVSPYPTGWPTEISLDVEWAHAAAPNAKIVLVVAPRDDEAEMTYVLHYAVQHQLGNIISNSYGYPEADYGPAGAQAFNTVIRQAAAQGIAVNVSSGDSGDLGLGTPVGAAAIPADSPFATAVGGTSLNVPSDNGPVEAAWGATITALASINSVFGPPQFVGFTHGGGGGESVYLPKPAYQNALPGSGRMLPDVSAFADPATGAIIVTPDQSGTQSVVGVIGGTSLSSPYFSGIWALANQAAGESLGQAAPIIAKMPAGAVTDIVPVVASVSNLHGSVTVGTTVTKYTAAALLNLQAKQPSGFVGVSASSGIDNVTDFGFGADSSLMVAPGWDNATGYGVPNGMAFINAAAAARAH